MSVEPQTRRAPRHRRWYLAGSVFLGGLVTLVALLSTQIMSPEQRIASAQPPLPTPMTAPVEWRTLAEVIVARGRIDAEQSFDAPRAAGDLLVVTSLPLERGDAVAEGDIVIVVNGRPIFALEGAVPGFRDLVPGARGDDVAQAQAALERLGYDVAADDPGRYGEATRTAIEHLYRDAGFEPAMAAESSDEALLSARADVAAAEGRLTDAEAALERAKVPAGETDRLQAEMEVAAAEAALRQAKAGGDRDEVAMATLALELARAGRDQVLATPDVSIEQAMVDEAAQAVSDARAARRTVEERHGAALPLSEVVWVSTLPGTLSAVTSSVGAIGGDIDTLATITAGRLTVRGDLSDAQAQVVQPGAPVVAEAEAAGITLHGLVAEVQADTAGNGARVTVEMDDPIDPALLGVDLRLTITTSASQDMSFVVPLAAVFATGDGEHRITVLDDEGTQAVVVLPGLSAGGFVAVQPTDAQGLEEGDLVVVGQGPS